MTVAVSNTNLNDSFNTWRLNTNLAATTLSNNVVTVSRAGSANRGGAAKGNGHVSGTFSATNLRTTTLKGGNTTADSTLTIASNTTISATSLSVSANTTFTGNVTFTTAGTDRVNLGDVSRLIISGGTRGQFLRLSGAVDNPDFKSLTLRDITDLSSNASNIILSGANSSFTAQGGQPAIVFSNGTDYAYLHLASDVTAGDSDVHLKLVDAGGDSRFQIADSSNNVVGHISSAGVATFTANVVAAGVTSSANILPNSDDAVDLGAPNREFRNLYVDGVANIDELSVATGGSQGVSTSLIPKTDAVGNLGSTTRKWGTVWADNTNGGAGVFNTVGVSSTLTANGLASLDGGIDVDGAFTVADTSGNISTSGTLNVDGSSTLNALTITTLTANGTATFNGNMTLGDAQTDTITVKGKFANQSTTGTASFNGDVNLGNASADTVKVKGLVGSDITPKTGQPHDLGTTSSRWDNVYANNAFANNITTDNDVTVGGDLTVNGTTSIASGQTFTSPIGRFTNLVATTSADFEGDTNIGTSTADRLTITSLVDSSILPTGTVNLGGVSNKWTNIYASGSLFVDTNADIDGKITNDGTTIIGSNGKLHANNTITAKTITTTMIANTMTSGGNFGSATQVPIVQVNDRGQVVGISETNVTGVSNVDYTQSNNTITITTPSGTTVKAPIDVATTTATTGRGLASFNSNDFTISSGHVSTTDTTVKSVGSDSGSATPSTHTFNIVGGEGIDTSGSGANITIAGENASTSNKGIASFDSGDFSVSSGAVSLADSASGAVLAISATANETTVSRSNGTVTVGLPNDVTIAGQLNVGENVIVSGNLIVSGTTTTVNSETVNIADNIIVLNSNETGTPSQNGGFTIERGTSTNYSFLWDESNDRWTLGDRNLVANTFIGNVTGNVTGNADTATGLSSAVTVQLTGDITGSATFTNGGDTASISTTYNNDVVLGTDTSGNYIASLSVGTGLDTTTATGEGSTPNITLDLSELSTSTTDGDGDFFVVVDASNVQRKLTKGNIAVSGFNTTNGIALGTDTTGNYVSTITAGGGINTNGAASGEGIAHTISIEADLRGDVDQVGYSTSDYYQSTNTTHDFYLDGVLDMRLDNSGNLYIDGEMDTNSTTTSSDEKLKDNITVVDNALAKIEQLRGVEFNWKKDGVKGAGVIAQDVEKVLPQAVKTVENPNTEEEYKSVRYDALHALLIEAVKELSARVKELESK